MMIKKEFPLLFVFLILIGNTAIAQKSDVTPLFQSTTPVEVKLGFSIKDVKKITNDTIYTPTMLSYKNDQGTWDSLNVDLRARGEFRRKNCFFPPIRLKMKKKDTEGTLFTGNKNLKLVVPCQTAKTASDLILKEYLAYKLYEPVTPYVFNTRLVNLTLTDKSGKQPKSYDLKGIFIEDDGLVAKRFDAKMIKDVQLHPMRMKDTASTIHDFFEFMISNTDWSSLAQHNIKVMQLKNKDYIPLTYDFDMSGLVNAPYAQVSELLEISSVQQRIYRGFCRTEGLFDYVRKEYLNHEAEMMKVFDAKEIADMNPKDLAGAKKYIGEFFTILKNDKSYKENILSKCRTNN
jgi:hypothetical protein